MTTLTWTSTSGSNIEAKIEYSATYYAQQPIDDGWGGNTAESYREDITITLFVNGRFYGVMQGMPMPVIPGYHDQAIVDAGCTVAGMITAPDGSKILFAATGITIDDFRTARAHLRATKAPEEVRRMIAAEEGRNVEEDRKMARYILNCGNVFADESARAAWERAYNDAVNEGGEGYIPMAVTRAEQDWAHKILGDK